MPRRRRRYYDGGRRRRRRSSSMTIPIAPIAGLAAGIAGPIFTAIGGNPKWGVQQAIQNYTGVQLGGENFDFLGWHPDLMARGLLPLAIGLAVHKYIGGRPLNANATLARTGIPFIRI